MPQSAEHQQQAERRLRALDAQPRFRELVDRKLKDRWAEEHGRRSRYQRKGHHANTCPDRSTA